MKPNKGEMAASLLSQVLRASSKKRFRDSVAPPPPVETAEEMPEGEAPEGEDMGQLEALLAEGEKCEECGGQHGPDGECAECSKAG